MSDNWSRLNVAPFSFLLHSDFDFVYDELAVLYGNNFSYAPTNTDHTFTDYRVNISDGGGLRSFFRRQARFLCDHREPFKPLNGEHAFAVFEWGLNWVIAAHEVSYVIIHSAVLEKNGKAVLFPAPPGSGKSTLTAYLSMNGWRLLSDEMALIQPYTRQVLPFVRPICLKNKSIDLVKNWFPQNQFSRVARHTHKGDVVHMAAPQSALENNSLPAEVTAVVFPNYRADTKLDIVELNQRETFTSLSENAFNYQVLGKTGFDTVCQVVESSSGFEIFYNDLGQVQAFLEEDVLK